MDDNDSNNSGGVDGGDDDGVISIAAGHTRKQLRDTTFTSFCMG